MKLGGQQGELSHISTPCQLQTQQEERGTLQVDSIFIPSQQKGESFPSSPSNSPANEWLSQSANEKPLYIEILVYSNGLFVYNSHPNFHLSSIKNGFIPLFSRFPRGFALVRLLQIIILCYS